jgi:hypothetical protein
MNLLAKIEAGARFGLRPVQRSFKKMIVSAFAARAVENAGAYSVEPFRLTVVDVANTNGGPIEPSVEFVLATSRKGETGRRTEILTDDLMRLRQAAFVRDLVEEWRDGAGIDVFLNLSIDQIANRVEYLNNVGALDGAPALRFDVSAELNRREADDVRETFSALADADKGDSTYLIDEPDDDCKTYLVSFAFNVVLDKNNLCWGDCRDFLDLWLSAVGRAEETRESICRWCAINKRYQGANCSRDPKDLFVEIALDAVDRSKEPVVLPNVSAGYVS